ncbi:hypothetical protein [Aeromonas jandaei]|uniref:hypothetical protein n=1 Tax=Aeromonas jandaei TaxID=650 RepID=UPI00207B4E20|nr:hypothetical protein [Aeromonas jandaei]
MLQEQPAVAKPAEWDSQVATNREISKIATEVAMTTLGFDVTGNVEPLNDWQQHPAIKSVIYQIDEADLLTPANTRLLAGYIKGWQASGADSENTLNHAIQMAKHLLNPEEEQLQLAIGDGEAA